MKRFALCLATLLCAATAFALDFTIEGVTYTTNGTTSVSPEEAYR